MNIEHDSVTSRRYKEDWDDCVVLLNKSEAYAAQLRASLEEILRAYGAPRGAVQELAYMRARVTLGMGTSNGAMSLQASATGEQPK